MSSRIFQGVILQLKEATDRCIGVLDADGNVICCSNTGLIGKRWQDAVLRLGPAEEVTAFDKHTFKPMLGWNGSVEYVVFAEGEDPAARSICIMTHVALTGAKRYYEEKHDRTTFVKNIITDNILPGDIYVRAKELHFSTEVQRLVFLVRQVGHADVAAVEVLQGMFPDRQQDFVININETDIAIVKQLNDPYNEAPRVAQTIEDKLKGELFLKTVIGIGTVANHLRELADSYKEAQVAIDVGKVFETEKTIISYENLGLGRLIYQLPTTLCEIFLSEVFKKNSIDSLDQETLFTINKFFENNLNVSETSRKLFVHRNTLVYRLEKIKKVTGLDLREFDHAIIFKVALMVKKYLASRDNHMA